MLGAWVWYEGAMSQMPEIRTERLRLRAWSDQDLEPFAAMNADARVMEHMPAPLSREESCAMVARIRAHFEQHGFGLWAVSVPEEADFIGYVGLMIPSFEAHFTPCVEVAWRLAHEHWGHGYATEGARAALDFAFERQGLDEVVSFTAMTNTRSWRVMERLGMRRRPEEDFDHPRLPEGHRLRRHVLYRMPREAWDKAGKPSS